ncbi:MAG: hypothetical protein M3Q44_04080 [bacterium]|nr:hypothetical protein [bacterium]
MTFMNFFTDTILPIIFGIAAFIGATAYLIKSWKQGNVESTNSTIDFLKDELQIVKTRLETTSAQVTQLNTQIITLSSELHKLKEENVYLRQIIENALKTYFEENSTSVKELQAKLKERKSYDQKLSATITE